MNTRIPITLLAAFALTTSALACDLCGVFLGISPNDRKSSIALFQRYRLLKGDIAVAPSLLKHADQRQESAHYRETYATQELRADLWFSQRISMLASLSLVQNTRSIGDDGEVRACGMGDPFLLARYAVVNTRGSVGTGRPVHRVLIGLGPKFPLGSTDRRYNDLELDHDLQPGTGSWDALASLEYHVRLDRWTASLQCIGRYNGENKEGLRSGTGASSSVELARMLNGEHVAWRPFIGAYHEWMGLDRHHGEVIHGTGCSTLFAHAGARAWFGRWSVSITGQYAVARDDGGSMVPNVFRGLAGIHFMLDRQDEPM